MKNPDWTSKGKTVADLAKELLSFEDQEMEVRISLDGGDTSLPVSLVGKSNRKYAVLINCQDIPTPIRHRDET
ncbi:hypothetical protein EA797_03990 [Stutzerimonas zhaodongensis]|uniref:Uncharacterized protein n=1 Tax=Stutzerimonas zhaodongensis TaxID=1176257 RepID=A0A3M2I0H6_9GAMM|nr:hypothetical protein EA797_03990 [Stutzerimonas zhaodongensis]